MFGAGIGRVVYKADSQKNRWLCEKVDNFFEKDSSSNGVSSFLLGCTPPTQTTTGLVGLVQTPSSPNPVIAIGAVVGLVGLGLLKYFQGDTLEDISWRIGITPEEFLKAAERRRNDAIYRELLRREEESGVGNVNSKSFLSSLNEVARNYILGKNAHSTNEDSIRASGKQPVKSKLKEIRDAANKGDVDAIIKAYVRKFDDAFFRGLSEHAIINLIQAIGINSQATEALIHIAVSGNQYAQNFVNSWNVSDLREEAEKGELWAIDFLKALTLCGNQSAQRVLRTLNPKIIFERFGIIVERGQGRQVFEQEYRLLRDIAQSGNLAILAAAQVVIAQDENSRFAKILKTMLREIDPGELGHMAEHGNPEYVMALAHLAGEQIDNSMARVTLRLLNPSNFEDILKYSDEQKRIRDVFLALATLTHFSNVWAIHILGTLINNTALLLKDDVATVAANVLRAIPDYIVDELQQRAADSLLIKNPRDYYTIYDYSIAIWILIVLKHPRAPKHSPIYPSGPKSN